MDLRIVTLPVVGFAGALVVAVVFARILLRSHSRKVRYSLNFGALLCALLAAAVSVNWYFQYFPTLNALVGNVKDSSTLASSLQQAQAAQPETPLPTHGSVVSETIPATKSGFVAREARVYLPPIWFKSPRPKLPVLVLMHGTPGTPDDWSRGGGAAEAGDAWAESHRGWAPIIVMPDSNGGVFKDTECVDGKQGNVETYLTTDLREFAIATLGASSDRRNWALGGLSEGGYCGAMLTLRHPDSFSSFLDFGGDSSATHTGGLTALFAGSSQQATAAAKEYDLNLLLKRYDRSKPITGWVIAGSSDSHIAAVSKTFAGNATAAGLDVQIQILPEAKHTFDTWNKSLQIAFPSTAQRIGAYPTSSEGR